MACETVVAIQASSDAFSPLLPADLFSMDLRNMPVLELLRYVAAVIGCEVTADKYRLTVAPAAKRKPEANPKSQGGGKNGPAKSSKRKVNR